MARIGRTRAAALAAFAIAGAIIVSGVVPANATEQRHYGARSCAGNVASFYRVNSSSWVEVHQVGGGYYQAGHGIYDNVWRSYTLYSRIKNSSGQTQHTNNYFASAYIFCDN